MIVKTEPADRDVDSPLSDDVAEAADSLVVVGCWTPGEATVGEEASDVGVGVADPSSGLVSTDVGGVALV